MGELPSAAVKAQAEIYLEWIIQNLYPAKMITCSAAIANKPKHRTQAEN